MYAADAAQEQDHTLKLWYEQPASQKVEMLPVGNEHLARCFWQRYGDATYGKGTRIDCADKPVVIASQAVILVLD